MQHFRALPLFIPFILLCNSREHQHTREHQHSTEHQHKGPPPKLIVIDSCSGNSFKKIKDTLFVTGLRVGDTLKVVLSIVPSSGYGWDMDTTLAATQTALKKNSFRQQNVSELKRDFIFQYIFTADRPFSLHFLKRRSSKPIAECYLKYTPLAAPRHPG